MIYDTIDHIGRYVKIHSGLEKGLRFLTDTDFTNLAAGRVEIDGDRVFALLQEYETKPENEKPEAHRAYIDIQYLWQGEERVGVAPLTAMEEETQAFPEKDIWFYRGKTEKLSIGNGRFLVLFPEDAHAPCIACGVPASVHKCVVKVRI